MADIKKVAVIGSGSWGTAAATLLRRNNHEVSLWSRNPKKCAYLIENHENKEYLPGVELDRGIEFTYDISCVSGKDLIVIAAPSAAVRQVSRQIREFLPQGQLIVILSKGLEAESNMLMSDVVSQECPGARVAVMSGPSHAEEASRGIPTLNVVASDRMETAEIIQDIFMSEVFRIYTGNDMIGVELGGAVKNVIALCAGVIDGIGFGDNTNAALMTRGIKEISRLGTAMGARADTFWGLSGIGDLIVTCTSAHSRNRRAGVLIGQGRSVEQALREVHMVVEGINTTRAAYELSRKLNVEMPIVSAAYDVLYNGVDPRSAVTSLMIRTKKSEII